MPPNVPTPFDGEIGAEKMARFSCKQVPGSPIALCLEALLAEITRLRAAGRELVSALEPTDA